jgi:hypothetical protein
MSVLIVTSQQAVTLHLDDPTSHFPISCGRPAKTATTLGAPALQRTGGGLRGIVHLCPVQPHFVPRLTNFVLLLLKFEVCSPVPGSTAIYSWNHSHAMEDQTMFIGERLRALREEKKSSQGDVEKRTG